MMIFQITTSQAVIQYDLYHAEKPVIPALRLENDAPYPQDVREQADWLAINSARLSAWLVQIENALQGDLESLAGYAYFISDAHLARSDYQSFVEHNGRDETTQPHVLAAWLIFFQALSRYLAGEERVLKFDARIAHLYSAWQAFFLARRLALANPADLQPVLAANYRQAAVLLEDPRYFQAAQVLVKWNQRDASPDMLSSYRMRLGLVLEHASLPENAQLNVRQPIAVPGAFAGLPSMWQETRLYPAFQSQPPTPHSGTPNTDETVQARQAAGARAVRRLISARVMPRYDFPVALQLARLLRCNQPQADFTRRFLAQLFASGLGWLAAVVLLNGFLYRRGFGPSNEWISLVGAGALFLLAAGLGAWVLRPLDSGSLSYLAMPRLVGGVAIGYFALVLQRDPGGIAGALFSNHAIPLVLSYLVVILIAGWYLYQDIRPMVQDIRQARRRAAMTIGLAVVITFSVGLIAVAFTTAAYPAQELAQQWLVLGPFGWLDLRRLLAFIPIALITGLISQFLFEGQAVTASVWTIDDV